MKNKIKKTNDVVGKKIEGKKRGTMLGGALIGATLGVVAGILLAPESGKKIRKDIAKMSGDFYSYLAPQVKKLKKVGEAEYHAFLEKSATQYAKSKQLSSLAKKSLITEAKRSWAEIKKNLG